MKPFKKAVLFLASLLPIPAISFAADFNNQIETPQISAFDLEQEFFRRLESDLLPGKYYKFFEQNQIFCPEDLVQPRNQKFRDRALKQFEKDLKDITLMASGANSMIPE